MQLRKATPALMLVVGLLLAGQSAAGRAPRRPPCPVGDELLVRPHGALRAAARARLAQEGALTRKEISQLDVDVIRTPPGTAAQVQKRLRGSGFFRFVEPNYIVHADMASNDPLYAQQWGLPITQAPAAWEATFGAGIVIAIMDTGIDASHPDLAANVIPGFNVLTESPGANDDNGHGTHMAGIAAAVGFNAIGVIGVAPQAALMPVKVLGASGSGTYADVAEGIVYATDHGARVISISLGGEVDSATLSSAIDYARSRGVVVTAAAGNDGIAAPNYPAAYPGVIAVGATDAHDAVASFSNFGFWVSLVAPGVDVLTTNAGGGYAYSTGTSPATPFVAGAAALLLAAIPQLDSRLVGSILTMTSDDLGPPGFDPNFGWGRLNIAAALAQASALAQSGTSPPPPLITVSSPPDAATVQGVVALAITSSNGTPIARVDYSVDGNVVATASVAPFNTQWDTTSGAAGSHVLTATAYTATGARSDAPPLTFSIAGPQPACTMLGAVCLPGGGAGRTDCYAEWLVIDPGAQSLAIRDTTVSCIEGTSCDADGTANGVCTFNVGVCVAVTNSPSGATLQPICQPQDLQQFALLTPRAQPGEDPIDVANTTLLVNAVAALSNAQSVGMCISGLAGVACAQHSDCDSAATLNDGICALQRTSLQGVAGERCTALQPIRVPLPQSRRNWRAGNRRFKAATTAVPPGSQRPLTDSDSLRLVCLPGQ